MTKNEAMFAGIGALAGAVIGGAAAFIIAKAQYTKKFNEEVAAIKATYEKLSKPKDKPVDEDTASANDSKQEEDEEPAVEDSDDMEDEGGRGSDGYDGVPDDPVENDEYDQLIEPYSGDLTIYNISEYEYEDDRNGYDKQEIVFFDEEEPHAIYSETGEEVPDWPQLLGYDEGCLCDEMFDSLQEA